MLFKSIFFEIIFGVGLFINIVTCGIVSDGNNLKLSSGSSGIVMTNSGFSNTFINGTPLSTFSFNNYPSDWEGAIQKVYYINFLPIQTLPPGWGGCMVQIGFNYFLVLASNQPGVNSQVFQWNFQLGTFQFYQNLTNSDMSNSFTNFVSGGITYLIQARNDTSPSALYQWDSNSESFVQVNTLPSSYAQKWAFLSLQTGYLVVSNLESNSIAYSFPFPGQNITLPTMGTMDCISFQISSNFYIAVANFYENLVQVYQFIGTFSFLQNISVSNPVSVKFYSNSAGQFLVITEATVASLWKWNQLPASFLAYTNFSISNAVNVIPLPIYGDTLFLASNNPQAAIYRIKGSFIPKITTIAASNGTAESLFFTIGVENFVLIPNGRPAGTSTVGVQSVVYKL